MPYILLVEADPSRAAIPIRTLTLDGYSVRHATSAASAMLAVRQEPPSLVLLNLDLPDVSGQTLALRIKHELRQSAPPIVSITTYNVVSSRQSARQAGCTMILTEPLSMQELSETVRRFERSVAA